MEKKAALNKLATAVREYIAAEQNYTKIAAAMQQVQMAKVAGIQKEAQMMDKIKGLLGMTPPPAPKGMGGGTKALLALLGAGGLGAGAAYASGAFDGKHPGSEGLTAAGNYLGNAAGQMGDFLDSNAGRSPINAQLKKLKDMGVDAALSGLDSAAGAADTISNSQALKMIQNVLKTPGERGGDSLAVLKHLFPGLS